MMVRRLATCSIVALALVMSYAGPTAAESASRTTNGLIVFGRGGDLLTVDPTGDHLRDLSGEATRFMFGPAWSPRGARIAFYRGAFQGNGLSIVLMHPDGSHHRRLTGPRTPISVQPSWSPDGETIAYSACGGDFDCPAGYRIVVRRVADGRFVRAIDKLSRRIDVAPAYSPNGEQIAFERCCFNPDDLRGTTELFVWSAVGNRVVRLTHNDVNDAAPSWLPDGSLIVYQRGGDNSWTGLPFSGGFIPGPGSIRTIDPVSGKMRSLTSGADDFDPAHSPDGRWIVFGRCPPPGVNGACDLFTMAPDGSHVRRLMASRGHEVDPAWQPIRSGVS